MPEPTPTRSPSRPGRRPFANPLPCRGPSVPSLAASLVATLVCLQAAGADRDPARSGNTARPNILFLFADDQCFQTIHALNNDEVQTPNLDWLVRNGTTFTHAYNMGSWSGAVCVASRTMLNTGRMLWRAQRVYKTAEKERAAGRFWSEILRKAGYETYFTGKWHVPANAKKAFDHAEHIRGGMPRQTPQGYNRPIEGQPDPWSPYDPKFGGFWEGGKHWSEVVRDDTLAFLEHTRTHDRPFFMYIAFNAVHDPRQSPREYVQRYPWQQIRLPSNFLPQYPFAEAIGCGPTLRDERLAPFPRTPYAVKVHRSEYYAILTHMDAQIGRILDALRASPRYGNTYIVFTADHGLAVGQHGLFGKQNMHEHSVRVPLMIVGPDVPRNRRIDGPVYLQDVMPTTLQWAGIEPPEHVEFRSLVPLIRGRRNRNYDLVYGAYLGLQRMIIDGDYKLIVYPKVPRVRLFDLKHDPDEMRDLAQDPAYKSVVKRLFRELLKLQQEMDDTLDLTTAFPHLAAAS